jgi:preprotein translocase subunit YajC
MSDSFMTQLIPLLMVFAIMYFLIIRPQQQKVKQHKLLIEAVRRGDTVVTGGGLVGRVTKVKDDGEVIVEVADNVQVRVLKSTLSEVRGRGEGTKADDKED